MNRLNKFFRSLSVKFLNNFFYSYMVELLEDEFDVIVMAFVSNEKVAESKMKRFPQSGMTIEFISTSAKGMMLPFKVENVTITHNGCVCKVYGYVLAN